MTALCAESRLILAWDERGIKGVIKLIRDESYRPTSAEWTALEDRVSFEGNHAPSKILADKKMAHAWAVWRTEIRKNKTTQKITDDEQEALYAAFPKLERRALDAYVIENSLSAHYGRLARKYFPEYFPK